MKYFLQLKWFSFIGLLLFFSFAFKPYQKEPPLCRLLAEMHEKDQRYRNAPEMHDPFFTVLDSIKAAEGLTTGMYSKLSEEVQLTYGRRARILADKKGTFTQKYQDSLMQMQKQLDIENTRELLRIVKEHGFPNIEKLGCKSYAVPFLIFGHAPEAFWKEIGEVIEVEKKKNRISEGDYNYIRWHIGSRKGNPIKTRSGDVITIKADF
ncbi:hypothetical protein [Ascidiimonas aurantiaca]|uniref:hypothetical protein n=1 Tax=Ascidiimonas aurantiaca TaxID=1685432 RepID=UPI0030EC63F0